MIVLVAIPVLPLLAALAAFGLGRRLPYGGGELIVGAVALSLVGLVLLPDGAAARCGSGRSGSGSGRERWPDAALIAGFPLLWRVSLPANCCHLLNFPARDEFVNALVNHVLTSPHLW